MLDLKETRKQLEKLDKKEVVDAFLWYLFDERGVRDTIKILEKKHREALKFLEENDLTESIEDKNDKMFDRGIKWFKELPTLMDTINQLKKDYLPHGMDTSKRSANFNSVTKYIDQE